MSETGHTVLATHSTLTEAVSLADELKSYVVVIEQGQPAARYEVGLEPLTVGRDQARHIVIGDAQVSRLHLQMALVSGEVVVEDLGSSNGTFLQGRRISGPTVLAADSWVQVGSHFLRHERRGRREMEREIELQRDLEKARSYVQSLLPAPLTQGEVKVDWHYCPSAQLGGDIFNYGDLDRDQMFMCLLDVSGHGVGPAMHSVSVLNVLRQRALLATDFADPAQVLESLNSIFPMDDHDGLFFTIWYGVYSRPTRTLRYASAGHHAAWLFAPDTQALPLRTPGPIIGVLPEPGYLNQEVEVPRGAVLYLFSDGVFEIETAAGHLCSMAEFLPLLGGAGAGTPGEAQQIFHSVKRRARVGPLADDFSLLVLAFD